ncbi:MAG: hypothetical protein ACXWKG_08615 [Limisphaerales bacterium]
MLVFGCVPLPANYSSVNGVYPRVGDNGKTNEAVVVVNSSSAWLMPLTPEGPHPIGGGFSNETKYYFSNRHIRRKPLPFLSKDDRSEWELIAPVEAAESWVRVQGLSRSSLQPANVVLITVFTPHQILSEQRINTLNEPSSNYVHFIQGNRVVEYNSGKDAFRYNALDNKVEGAR